MTKKQSYVAFSLFFILSGAVGWYARGVFVPQQIITTTNSHAVRAKGSTYTSPLLTSDISASEQDDRLGELQNEVETFIKEQEAQQNIGSVSVYLQSYAGPIIDINPDEQYAPASLNKVPLMITIYKMAEKDPNFLNKKITLPEDINANAAIEIPPASSLERGKTYTVQEALDKMITYSDNNAYEILTTVADLPTFQQVYKDLGIELKAESNQPVDFITAKQYSLFLRILYNSTYLTQDYSEKALELLTKVDYKDGLVAGIDSSVKVAHKFGISTIAQSPTSLTRELHDCGIVYFPTSPYLLCIMTKGSGTLAEATHVVSGISSLVFNTVKTGIK